MVYRANATTVSRFGLMPLNLIAYQAPSDRSGGYYKRIALRLETAGFTVASARKDYNRNTNGFNPLKDSRSGFLSNSPNIADPLPLMDA